MTKYDLPIKLHSGSCDSNCYAVLGEKGGASVMVRPLIGISEDQLYLGFRLRVVPTGSISDNSGTVATLHTLTSAESIPAIFPKIKFNKVNNNRCSLMGGIVTNAGLSHPEELLEACTSPRTVNRFMDTIAEHAEMEFDPANLEIVKQYFAMEIDRLRVEAIEASGHVEVKSDVVYDNPVVYLDVYQGETDLKKFLESSEQGQVVPKLDHIPSDTDASSNLDGAVEDNNDSGLATWGEYGGNTGKEGAGGGKVGTADDKYNPANADESGKLPKIPDNIMKFD